MLSFDRNDVVKAGDLGYDLSRMTIEKVLSKSITHEAAILSMANSLACLMSMYENIEVKDPVTTSIKLVELTQQLIRQTAETYSDPSKN